MQRVDQPRHKQLRMNSQQKRKLTAHPVKLEGQITCASCMHQAILREQNPCLLASHAVPMLSKYGCPQPHEVDPMLDGKDEARDTERHSINPSQQQDVPSRLKRINHLF